MTFSFNGLYTKRLSTFKYITSKYSNTHLFKKLLINIVHAILPQFFSGEINILFLTVDKFFSKIFIPSSTSQTRNSPTFPKKSAKWNAREKNAWPRVRLGEWAVGSHASRVLRATLLFKLWGKIWDYHWLSQSIQNVLRLSRTPVVLLAIYVFSKFGFKLSGANIINVFATRQFRSFRWLLLPLLFLSKSWKLHKLLKLTNSFDYWI